MNICLSINSKFLEQTIVFLNSFFLNNKGKHNIYILHKELSNEEIKRLEDLIKNNDSTFYELKVDKKIFENMPKGIKDSYPMEIYYKLLIPNLVPNDLDRILFCDVDMIVNKSINDLFTIDFEDKFIAACSDYFVNKYNIEHKKNLKLENENYFNVGVLLLNLNKLRQIKLFEQSIEIIEKNKEFLKFPEQDILNIICKDKVIYLDEKYNYITKIRGFKDLIKYIMKKDNREEIVIFHYAGIKPCNSLYDGKYYELFWKYVDNSISLLNYQEINSGRKKKYFIILLRIAYRCVFHVRKG